jgi:glycosyltransferase involved in cell wall biosynthesis
LQAYHKWSQEQFSFIPDNVEVIRAYARDVSRHFSWRGKYLSFMALPDHWQSWIAGGIISGLMSILRNRPDVIVSTYPIASAHIIAYLLHRLTGVPWVADLRDPMAQIDYPVDPGRKSIFEWIERKIVKHCSFVTVTAPGAKAFYLQKFSQSDEDFWQILPNGFDEDMFEKLNFSASSVIEAAITERPYTILHSGVIYPSERDPSQLFAALAELKQKDPFFGEKLHLRLRASGHESLYQKQIDGLNISDLVTLAPAIPYMQALGEMLSVDGLLLLQADNCNFQIPAKAYEYIRVQKPVLALTPEQGDTGKLLAESGMVEIAPLDDKQAIRESLVKFMDKLENSAFTVMDDEEIQKYSRQYQAVKFEQLLKAVISNKN